MNSCGQMILSKDLNFDSLNISRERSLGLKDAGVESLHSCIGLLEIPNTYKPKKEGLYVYSIEAPKISSLCRMMVRRDEEHLDLDKTFNRLIEFPESGNSCALLLEPLNKEASRKGWSLLSIKGFVGQQEEKFLFPTIFYEISWDIEGGNLVFIPVASERHYPEEVTIDSYKKDIWGFEEEPYNLVEDYK